jgi:MoaA/NifB/PqqE/SkfB family radical SAM enzyme
MGQAKMRKVPLAESVRIIARGTANWIADRPIVVSFEVTDSCNCFCRHCDHGGMRDDSANLRASDYSAYVDTLNPCVVQVSGGEPLLRDDIVDIVRSIKRGSGVPYTILVSNWALMTERKYEALCQAGIDQFSVSLDFPDDRHDGFRGFPGLYQHLRDLIPRLAKAGRDDIVLNSCITSLNVGEINRMADKAREWGVNMCFSAYSARRTGCRDLFLNDASQLETLRNEMARIESRRDSTNWIQFSQYELADRERMIEEFTAGNACGECYVSIRSYLDKSFPQLLGENVRAFFAIGSERASARTA